MRHPDHPRPAAPPPGIGLVVTVLALGLLVTAGQRAARPVPVDSAAPARGALPLPDLRIDLNRASAAQLLLLPGVGPRLAERIVEHRRSAGPFQRLADLDAVPGVGPATVERVAPYAAVGPDPSARPGPVIR